MKIENAIEPAAMNGFATSGIFDADRRKKDAPRITVTMNELAQAIFTSGARSRERNVASANAAACSGTTGKRSSSRRTLARAAAAVDEAGAVSTRAAALPPVSP